MISSTDFHSFDSSFQTLLGDHPTLEILASLDDYPFAHEAGVFIASTNELFITSNRYQSSSSEPCIAISKISLGDGSQKVVREEIPASEHKIPMANGGVNYQDNILICGQGNMTEPSGLYLMSRTAPHHSKLLVSDFHGRQFNSTNDVVVHSDGSIWFTDPIYGYEQGYRPKPELPGQIYRWDPKSGGIRVLADGFGRCNGIAFSPHEKVVYVTDTDWCHGDGTIDGGRASTIYAFDITYHSGQPFMTNRRLFAFAANGVPDGIKCDMEGNVYSGCGDGINVWSPGGVLLGIIKVDGGAANFCFGKEGAIYILNEHRLWKAQLNKSIRGALLRI